MGLAYTEFRLHFPHALRLGDAHVTTGYPTLHSDWFMQVLRSGYRRLTGADMPGWPEQPVVRISSLFPFAGELALAPLPFSQADDDAALIDVRGRDVTPTALNAWRIVPHQRAGIDRTTQRIHARYTVLETFFAEDAGFWFGARFADDSDATKAMFRAVLRLIGDEGIGGGRSAGAGTFQVVSESLVSPEPAAASEKDGYWCLSRYIPSDAEYTAGTIFQGAIRLAQQRVRDAGNLPLAQAGSVLPTHAVNDPLAVGTAKPIGDDHRAGFAFLLPVPQQPETSEPRT